MGIDHRYQKINFVTYVTDFTSGYGYSDEQVKGNRPFVNTVMGQSHVGI